MDIPPFAKSLLAHLNFNHIQVFTIVIVIGLTTLLGIDSIGNSETVFKFTGVHSHTFVIPTLLLLFLIRLKYHQLLPKNIARPLALLTMGVLAITVGATLYDAVTPVNALYALTRLHQTRLSILPAFLSIVLLLNQNTRWWQRHWQKVIVILPFVIFFGAVLINLFPFNVFLELVKEDRLVENTQFWVLALGSAVALWHSLQLRKTSSIFTAGCFLCIAVVFALIAGDEISWGQRILGIQTHEYIKTINRQEELTIHNLYALEWLVKYGYATVAFLGIAGWPLLKIAQPRMAKYAPSWLLIGYFLLPFGFYAAQIRILWGIWHRWSEVAELYLYAGVVLWSVLLGWKLVHYKKRSTTHRKK